ncbi:MAG: hypothetical protein ACI9XO_000002 [Paraglaciecola sp.]|jgi:hypothetical protein
MTINQKIAYYLYQEKTRGDRFIISPEAASLHAAFLKYEKSVKALEESPSEQFELIQQWVGAFQSNGQITDNEVVMEVAVLLLTENFDAKNVVHTETKKEIAGMHGEHGVLKNGSYDLDYNHFMNKLAEFQAQEVPKYEQFTALKKSLAEQRKKALRLGEFKPRVLSSFVRNKLIDKVYLPIFGNNLAKKIGTAGKTCRRIGWVYCC